MFQAPLVCTLDCSNLAPTVPKKIGAFHLHSDATPRRSRPPATGYTRELSRRVRLPRSVFTPSIVSITRAPRSLFLMFIKKFEHASGSESAFNFLYVAVVVVGLVVVAVVIAVSVQSFRGWGRSGPLPRQSGAVCFRRLDRVSEFKRNRHVQAGAYGFSSLILRAGGSLVAASR